MSDAITLRFFGCVLLCTILGACSRPTSEPAALFPNAVEVRVTYGDGDLSISQTGKIFAAKTDKTGRHPVTTIEGGPLSAAEVNTLRRSVTFASAFPDRAVCCMPRHAFVFFGKNHTVLGQFDICFECGCAYIIPRETHDKRLPHLTWNRAALARIVRAHGLPLQPTE